MREGMNKIQQVPGKAILYILYVFALVRQPHKISIYASIASASILYNMSSKEGKLVTTSPLLA